MRKTASFAALAAALCLSACMSAVSRGVVDGNAAAVRAALDKGESPDARSGQEMMTPLMLAAQAGRVDIMKLLLDKGARIDASFDQCLALNCDHLAMTGNGTALNVAANAGQLAAVKLLVERGADVGAALAFAEGDAARWPKAGDVVSELSILRRHAGAPAAAPAAPAEPAAEASSDVDQAPAAKARRAADAYAVVIGVERYRGKLPKADFAARDARAVSDYLVKTLGYPAAHVVTLVDDGAAKSDFEKYFERWLANNVTAGSDVFVYYSGHGAPDLRTGDAFLVPYDGDPAFLEETAFSLKRLYADLGKLPAKSVVVALDSCFSGAGGRSVVAPGARPLVTRVEAFSSLPKDLTVLAASAAEQASSTYAEKGHGLFTYFLLKGLRDRPVVGRDGELDLPALYGYLKPEVQAVARRAYNNEQTPQLLSGAAAPR